MADAFCKPSFFLNNSTLLYDGEQLKQLLVHFFGACVSSVLLLCSKKCVCIVYKPSMQKVRNIAGKMLITTSWFKIQEN